MTTRSSTNARVDAFVTRVNQGPRPRMPAGGVPDELRLEAPDENGLVRWEVRPIREAPWIALLEERLPRRLPPSFKSLVARYTYPSFEVGSVRLFANTGHTLLDDELCTRVFRDQSLAAALIPQGFVPFGQPTSGSYDPVCLDLGRQRGGGECPVVQLDHEPALQHGRIQVVRVLAGSFLELLEEGPIHS